MIKAGEIKEIFQDSLDKLLSSGMIDSRIDVNDDLVLLGEESSLDSISFVTFFMDIEEGISKKTNSELYLSIDKIIEFNSNGAGMTVKLLIDYIENELSGKNDNND